MRVPMNLPILTKMKKSEFCAISIFRWSGISIRSEKEKSPAIFGLGFSKRKDLLFFLFVT